MSKKKKSASKPAPKRATVVPDPLSLEAYGVPAPKYRTIATAITHGRTDTQTFSGSKPGSKKPATRRK